MRVIIATDFISGGGWVSPTMFPLNEALHAVAMSYATALTNWIQDVDSGCWLDRNIDHHHHL